jgi:hypothetical protein
MKLSDAIRLGAMIRPKISGYFFKDGASCAQGAALEASGTAYDDDVERSFDHGLRVRQLWPEACGLYVRCPACGGSLMPLLYVIAHLNNENSTGHGWTREAIADWVETIEGLKQASDGTTDVDDARSPVPVSVDGGDRE